MIVNCYHHVTNKFPYHSTCFEMYTVPYSRFHMVRTELSKFFFFFSIDDRKLQPSYVTNEFLYHSSCLEMYTVTWGFTWWRPNYPSFSFSLASMIVNCYHHVTNKFPYHSTCFEMYTVTWGLTWWRQNYPSFFFFFSIDDRKLQPSCDH